MNINFENLNCNDRRLKKMKLEQITREEIYAIIEDSVSEIKKIHNDYNSRHEAFGLIKEEFEEMEEEIEDLRTGIFKDYWAVCRKSEQVECGEKYLINLLKAIKAAAVCASVEMIHVGIVAARALELEERKKDK